MFKFLTSNLPAKILALVFALSLWIYVVGVSDKVGILPFKVPIEVKNLSSELAIANDLGEAELKIKAPYASWERLKAEDFSCYLDLLGFGPGEYELELKTAARGSEVSIIDKNPSKVKLKIDPLSSKKVPVEVALEGKPAEGFIVTTNEVEPSEVEIKGATSILENILALQAQISLSGEMSKTEREVALSLPSPYQNLIKNLTLNPRNVKVTILIQRSANVKAVGIKLNLKGEPSSGFWISKIITEPSSLAITAKAEILKRVEYLETEPIDIRSVSSNLVTTARLVIPKGIVVIGSNRVKVRIYLAPQLSLKTIPAQIRYKNGSGSTSEIVKVTLSGLPSQLASVSSKNVILEIDLAGRSGTIYYEIKKEMISVPSGCEIIEFSPKTIIVNVN